MGLNMSRAVVARAHVLIAEAPGAFRVRVGVEHAIDAASWCQTETVADADVLVVVGSPGPELAAIIDRTWAQMSEPRARIGIDDEQGIKTELARARDALVASANRCKAEPRRPDEASTPMAHDANEHEHGGHDHGSMSPDGIGLAEGAEDRDGLEMDELHLPLGPVLNHWPAGVVLHLTLNGDVATAATGQRLDSPGHRPPPRHGPEHAARLLDSAASLLSLAGLPAQSARARRLRDRCLTEPSVDPHDVDVLAQRLRRLRILRWLWRQTTVTDDEGHTLGLHDQLIGLVEQAARSLQGESTTREGQWPSLGSLPELVRGQELSAVRLWVAALGVAHEQ